MSSVKKILKLESESKKYPDVHPFTVVKKRKLRKKSILYFLIFLTTIIYAFIFYINFFEKEKKYVKRTEIYINTDLLKKQVSKEVSKSINTIDIPKKLHKKNTKELFFKKALEAYRTGNNSEALYYIKLLLSKEEYIPAILLKAKIFKKEGLEDRARAILEEAYYKYPENKDILLELAFLYETEGAFIIAKDMYETLSKNGYIEGYKGLARIYEKLGKRRKALSIYKKLYQNPNLSQEEKEEVEKKIILLEK